MEQRRNILFQDLMRQPVCPADRLFVVGAADCVVHNLVSCFYFLLICYIAAACAVCRRGVRFIPMRFSCWYGLIHDSVWEFWYEVWDDVGNGVESCWVYVDF